MIQPLKEVLKRHWPALPLRSILFLTLLFVAALPGIGAVFLRVYENTLVQQTEAELIAQGAALSGAYRAVWRQGEDQSELRQLQPQRPSIDLNAMPILPEQPDAIFAAVPPDPLAVRVAQVLAPIVADTRQTTLASINLLDRRGTVLLGRAGMKSSFRHVPEVRVAMAGRTSTTLRRRNDYARITWLEVLSRVSGARVHHVRPVMHRGQVIGIIMLSRSPRGLFLGMYQDRGKIALGVGAIFVTLLFLAGLLSRGIARPIEALSEATQNVARGALVVVPDPPVTAANEIRALYESFATMAERIERRSRYLRDFAAAVSHEFKTPIAGMRGALELLEEHGASMSEEERARFLANAMADADRLSHLLQRLLHLARADMAVAPEDSASDIAEPVRRIADAHQNVRVTSAVEGVPKVAAPPELVETVLETLVENSQQAGAASVSISARPQAAGVLIRVEDDGPGISAADHDRIFEPFHTSRRAEGGSGLGLSIARSLLASCSGTIVSRPAEQGACFEISLPAATSA